MILTVMNHEIKAIQSFVNCQTRYVFEKNVGIRHVSPIEAMNLTMSIRAQGTVVPLLPLDKPCSPKKMSPS